jgi:hypothetical protein
LYGYPGIVNSGLEAGDCICQTLADDAGLSGEFVAWLSDSGVDARDRLTNVSNQWVLPSGDVVAEDRSDLVDISIDHAINVDETGVADVLANVWTHTSSIGTKLPTIPPISACADWTSASVGIGAQAGATFRADAQWTSMSQWTCNARHRIYCLEQAD